jgi:hypothetical protein
MRHDPAIHHLEEERMKPGIKAGLIGGAVLVVLNLIGLVPVLGCISMPLQLLAYVGIGMLAGFWLAPRREGGKAAGQGAIAGLMAAAIGGLASIVLAPVTLALSGGPQTILNQIPAESLEALRSAGIDPTSIITGGTTAGLTAICCVPVGLLLGAGLGALGGLIFAGIKPGEPDETVDPPS